MNFNLRVLKSITELKVDSVDATLFSWNVPIFTRFYSAVSSHTFVQDPRNPLDQFRFMLRLHNAVYSDSTFVFPANAQPLAQNLPNVQRVFINVLHKSPTLNQNQIQQYITM